MALALDVDRRDACTVIRVAGDLDLSTADQLRRTLTATIADQPLVVLDLSAVPFLDCVGVGVLVSARSRARAAGGDLRLAAPAPVAARLLDVCGLLHVFVVADSVEATLTAAG